jgi:hypothetical protein
MARQLDAAWKRMVYGKSSCLILRSEYGLPLFARPGVYSALTKDR